ncbi:MAG TPA: hypothetical protein HPP65_10790 [Gammaproteobacteria bacterium]|jgi:hypothetical protein|nr:hypothetical protein [Gammaproteobacteria bacterium]MBT3846187.1 hypothetical protein [Gammaproteobacteria bacterium]MBT3894112.1 hypothetical protein [Gammaproteobacteria bacterium]MBT4300450.1 hypothetical protein [Gammaproteobacteria bacterium]MBT5687660.1 hypothetical protein [Gammaproteobacteria bacterium]
MKDNVHSIGGSDTENSDRHSKTQVIPNLYTSMYAVTVVHKRMYMVPVIGWRINPDAVEGEDPLFDPVTPDGSLPFRSDDLFILDRSTGLWFNRIKTGFGEDELSTFLIGCNTNGMRTLSAEELLKSVTEVPEAE